MYEIDGEDPYLYEWIEDEEDSEIVEKVLDWLPIFASDPHGNRTAMRFRQSGVTCMCARVPETNVFIDYTVTEKPPVIIVVGVETRHVFMG